MLGIGVVKGYRRGGSGESRQVQGRGGFASSTEGRGRSSTYAAHASFFERFVTIVRGKQVERWRGGVCRKLLRMRMLLMRVMVLMLVRLWWRLLMREEGKEDLASIVDVVHSASRRRRAGRFGSEIISRLWRVGQSKVGSVGRRRREATEVGRVWPRRERTFAFDVVRERESLAVSVHFDGLARGR